MPQSKVASQVEHRDSGPAPVDFQREVLPLLSDRCFLCHGPDSGSNDSGLRLDLGEAAHAEAPSGEGQAIVAGEPDESLLIRRLITSDSDLKMPPEDSHRTPLTESEIDTLKRWIAEGGNYEPHWSWQTLPDFVPVPQHSDDSWSQQPMDRFVWSRLIDAGFQPSPAADRYRWLRRVTFDLTGLPPSLEEIESFVNDSTPGSEERVVDRLLASRAFGEHLAIGWLDAARYADSYGYQSDLLCTVWPYRDWVVDAFNQNLPYDEFLTWQLAGDLLPQPTEAQRIATAFNRLHRQTNEGGSIDLEWRIEYAADRVNTFGTAMLGLTLECARCHDHKFDPISTRDYYQLMSFFNNIDEYGLYNNSARVPTPSLLLPNEDQRSKADALAAQLAENRRELERCRSEAREDFETWIATDPEVDMPAPEFAYEFDVRTESNRFPSELPGGPEAITVPENQSVPRGTGQAVRFTGDHNLYFDGLPLSPTQPFSISMQVKIPEAATDCVIMHQQNGTDVGFSGVELSLREGRLFLAMIRFWPGNALAIESAAELPRNQWLHLVATYDGSVTADGMRLFLNGESIGAPVRDRLYKSSHSEGRINFGERFRSIGFQGGEIDSLSVHSRALTQLEVDTAYRQTVSAEHEPHRTKDDYFEHFLRRESPAFAAVWKKRLELERLQLSNNDGMTELMVMEELPGQRSTYILERGDYDAPRTPEKLVARDTIKSLFPFPAEARRDRLGLAEWLTHPDHPLTARVAVNRIWQNFFGKGLVTTPGDFGVQGARPLHVELLDWMARDFVNHDWDVKRLCRQIALSATYRQDSRVSETLRQADPDNLHFARGPVRRLSAEATRDLFLFSSGLLKEKTGGPPVSPYQPPGLWRESNSMSPAYQQSTGDDPFRRSLYSVWKRTAPLPNMIALDAPGREVCTVERILTNTPVQAFVTLNDPQFVEAACHLGARFAPPEMDDESVSAAMEQMFLAVTGRPAAKRERELLQLTFEEQLAIFRETPGDAKLLLATGSGLLDPTQPEKEMAQRAALAMVAQAILNTDMALMLR